MSDVRLSKEAEAFVREKDLSNVADTFINDGFVLLFGQRQYEGRNIVWVYAIAREKGNK